MKSADGLDPGFAVSVSDRPLSNRPSRFPLPPPARGSGLFPAEQRMHHLLTAEVHSPSVMRGRCSSGYCQRQRRQTESVNFIWPGRCRSPKTRTYRRSYRYAVSTSFSCCLDILGRLLRILIPARSRRPVLFVNGEEVRPARQIVLKVRRRLGWRTKEALLAGRNSSSASLTCPCLRPQPVAA